MCVCVCVCAFVTFTYAVSDGEELVNLYVCVGLCMFWDWTLHAPARRSRIFVCICIHICIIYIYVCMYVCIHICRGKNILYAFIFYHNLSVAVHT